MSFARIFILAIQLALFGSSMDNAFASAQRTDQPRPFGYVIGDILTQRIHLNADGRAFVPAELPRVERAGVSLWRREVRQETDSDGEHWLVLRYQIINAPQSLAVWGLPELLLKDANSNATLVIPPWPFSIGPLTPPQPFGKDGLPALRDDRLPSPVPLAPLDRRIRFAVGGLLLTLLSWAGCAYWLHLKTGRHRPFARAMRDMRVMQENSPSAWRRLQHALNDAAGHVVRADTLDKLIERAPYLAQERHALEQFCRETSALFFGHGVPADMQSVHDLARRLHRLERRHAS